MSNKSKKPDVSVILTGYNEGEKLLENLNRVKNTLLDTKYSWEMILFDDKSTDQTAKTFALFAKNNKNVKFYANRKNMGRGRTVRNAIEMSKGKVVGYLDTDLELSPVYIPEFIRDIDDGADVVIARRIYVVGATNFTRAILSKGYVFLVNKLLGIRIKDTEAGFKFFSQKKALPIIRKCKDNRWFFDTEVVARSIWAGLEVKEIPVVYIYNPRKASSVDPVKDAIRYFRKLLLFRKERK